MQHRHFVFVSNPRETRKNCTKLLLQKPLLLWKKEKTEGKKTALLSTSRGRTFFLSLHQERSNAKTFRSSYIILIILKQKTHLRRSQGEGGKKSMQITRTEEETEETPQ
jgi:hypothetical protein